MQKFCIYNHGVIHMYLETLTGSYMQYNFLFETHNCTWNWNIQKFCIYNHGVIHKYLEKLTGSYMQLFLVWYSELYLELKHTEILYM